MWHLDFETCVRNHISSSLGPKYFDLYVLVLSSTSIEGIDKVLSIELYDGYENSQCCARGHSGTTVSANSLGI